MLGTCLGIAASRGSSPYKGLAEPKGTLLLMKLQCRNTRLALFKCRNSLHYRLKNYSLASHRISTESLVKASPGASRANNAYRRCLCLVSPPVNLLEHSFFPPILEQVFDLYVELIVLCLIPTYVYLNIRKNAAMDDTERRTCLFGFCLATGILLGHLIGGTLTSIVPSVFFIPPLLLALLMDNELLRTPLAGMDRTTFFAGGGFASSILCTMLAIIAVGKISYAIFLTSLVHVAFLTIHFQVVTQCVKEKIMMVGESQFSYIIGVLIIQILMTAMLGSNPNAHDHQDK
ncbi:hypothetical protein KIN20_034727 [Parelaphostrongylus tenuis]|uniref:Uncharacterized protein n=1 Tax=Parelaphostrongylus tenuis TaxID=148309 RepID=A0AAD5WKA1_PARTN|nr:hypothetical protein KIN20_034727 [Parelaphostrongylus tenuis]